MNKLFVIFLIFNFLKDSYVDAQLRLCEAEGSCRHCSDNRYSYYRCRMQDDCFIGEICDSGFCCPNMPPTFSLQREPAQKVQKDPQIDDPCPDGTKWERRCAKDSDCTHEEELCTEGKCCKTCLMVRRELLDSLRTVEILGQAIPQCEEDGLSYRRRQCLAGTDICWCVNRYGRRLSRKEYKDERECETVRRKQENMALKAAALLKNSGKQCIDSNPVLGECPPVQNAPTVLLASLDSCQCHSDCLPDSGNTPKKCCPTNNENRACLPVLTTPIYHHALPNTTPNTNKLPSTLSLVCGANEQYSDCYSACQPSCQDPSTPACPAPGCQPGCICLPGYIRRDGSPRSSCVPRALCQAYDLTIRCADDRRQYQTCGSACPISCETRNQPRCSEKCVTGCFCKVPYILENSQDPLHSRCILPSECGEQHTPPPQIVEQYLLRNPQGGQHQQQYVTTPPRGPELRITPTQPRITPTLIPNSENHCSDPLKNYLSCGSKCPASCDRPLSQAASLECALSCVFGCFCRLPYVLLDSTDPNSSCILPQLCPRKSVPPSSATLPSNQSCPDLRKEWTQCGALQCARSCSNPLGRCASGQCSSGCVCREPYVLLHPNDPTSRCVLPSECERSCEDPSKEFITCGSSCPMGCDNRHPKNCAPCQTGCFCRNGLVFEVSATWHTSKCVRIEDCKSEENEGTTEDAEDLTTTTTVPTTTTTTETTTDDTNNFGIALSKNRPEQTSLHNTDLLSSISPQPSTVPVSQCPATTFDVGGRGCNTDIDCPVEQRCCRPMIVSLGVNPQRCVCPDKHAVWSSCGTLCPEYCGQPSIPVCSGTCSAGCHCAPGFVRARNDVTAPCVPRDSCSTIIAARFAASQDEPVGFRFATIKEITPQDPFVEDVIAIAILTSRDDSHVGRFTFSQVTPSSLKIHGEVYGLPVGRHAVVVHQFGDSSEGCSRVGAPFSRSFDRSPSLGDITESGKFDRIVDWPVQDVVGRAIVIYTFSTSEWESKTHFGEKPLACGTIGIAKT